MVCRHRVLRRLCCPQIKEGDFWLSDILLILGKTYFFYKVEQFIYLNDFISLFKFDHLIFAIRSAQSYYFILNLKDVKNKCSYLQLCRHLFKIHVRRLILQLNDRIAE